jgi:ribosomal protein L7Ae-like RNA K-turn-binding protein
MTPDKVLGLLGLAVRARKVVSGEDTVLKEIRHHDGAVVFLASDAGGNITKKIQNTASTYHCTIIDWYTAGELSRAMGQPHRTVALITDRGFNQRFQEYYHTNKR